MGQSNVWALVREEVVGALGFKLCRTSTSSRSSSLESVAMVTSAVRLA